MKNFFGSYAANVTCACYNSICTLPPGEQYSNDKGHHVTKIKDMARITPLKASVTQTISTQDHPAGARNGANNPGFRKFLEIRHDASVTLRELTAAAIYEHEQPLTLVEVAEYLNTELGTDYSENRVRYGIDALVADGVLISRKETYEERQLRTTVGTATALPATLFYRPNPTGKVPARTVAEVIPGVTLKGALSGPRASAAGTRKTKVAKPVARPAAGGFDSAAFDFLIEKLVTERTVELQKKLDDANAKLAAMKKLMS